MSFNLERHWYNRSLTWLTFLLLPFSFLFGLIVKGRTFLFKHNILKSIHFSVPVIVVGNLTVGGTGKTPFVIWLSGFLKTKTWRPGIVSRGVGGAQHATPVWVDKHSDPHVVGDEALLLARHSACPVVICVNRVDAVRELLSKTDCNIIISDDGLQHYRLGRSMEVVVIDGDRKFGNGYLLPAGPLRETAKRLVQVDFVIQHGGNRNNACFYMQLQGEELVSIVNPYNKLPLAHFKNTKVHAVAGIGNPKRFFAALRQQGLDIMEHVFPDHYLYQQEDFLFADDLPIVMTEKDRVKCEEFADQRFWYLPVVAVLDQKFENELLTKL